jgi:hypothetical protein
VRRWQRVLSSLPSAGAPTRLPQTLREGLPPSAWRWQRGLAWFSAPEHPIWPLRPSSATEGLPIGVRPCGSGAGAGPHTITRRDCRDPERRGSTCPSQRAGAGHSAYGRMSVRRRSAIAVDSPVARLAPEGPSAAAGSLAPRPAPRSHLSIAPTGARLNLSSTARAHGGAKPVNAWPWPCLVSKRARDLWPAGWVRRHRPAASEKAHGRYAFPLLAPVVPSRFPTAAWAQGTTRQEDTPSGPRGQRVLACLS